MPNIKSAIKRVSVIETKTLQNNMGLEQKEITYNVKEIGDFYGTYYGQLGVNVEPDKMYVLTNDEIEECITYNYETQKTGKVYEENKSSDKYDIFLSGATPLITIENQNSTAQKELLLFRDSFFISSFCFILFSSCGLP